MTKQDPSKLCKACKAFDQMMNDQGEGDIRLSLDVYVQCEHEEEMTESKCPECQKLRDINNKLQQIIAIVKSDVAFGEQRLDEFIDNANDLLKKITTQAQEMGLYDSQRMKRLKELGFIGCLNDSGVTSQNYKELLGPTFPFGPIPHWIKCSDQPPEEKQECLVAIPFKDYAQNDYTYDLATYIEGGFISWTMPYHKNLNAIFWMPLPKRPGEND